jgi:hypothetical protein
MELLYVFSHYTIFTVSGNCLSIHQIVISDHYLNTLILVDKIHHIHCVHVSELEFLLSHLLRTSGIYKGLALCKSLELVYILNPELRHTVKS